MVLDLTDERHPTLFKDVRFYIWPTRWAKPSEELARFIRRKGGKCYDWHALDLKHNELVARVNGPGIVLVDPTEQGSPELLSKRQEEGVLTFVSWAYPHLCFQRGEIVNLEKAAKQLLFVRMCDGTPYAFYFDCDETNSRELRQMGELKIQFINHGGRIVGDPTDADAIITVKEGDALQDLQTQYSFATPTRVETFNWFKDCLNRSAWRFSPPSRKPLGGRPGQKKTFTREEDTLLVKYLAEASETSEGRQGQILYKRLVTLGENDASYSWVKRHSWQSWRNHYIKPPRKDLFENWIEQYRREHPRAQTDGYGTYPYRRSMNRRNMVAGRLRRQVEQEDEDEVDEEAEVEEEIDELESDVDAELQHKAQTNKKGAEPGSEQEEQPHQGQRRRDIPVPPEVQQEDEEDVSVLPEYEDDGVDAYSEEHEEELAPPPVKAKRQHEADDDAEDNEGEESKRLRKRRKTELTQATLVNPTQYNPFRGSPLSRAAASERAPFQAFASPTRYPVLDFSKSTKRIPVRPLPVMGFTTGRAKTRKSVAQRVAEQTFVLEQEDDEDEVPEVVVSSEEGLPRSGRHQEEEFGEAADLRAPQRQRKSKLNPDLIPALTYQTVRTGVKTRSQSRADTPLGDAQINTRSSARKAGRIPRGNKRY